MDQPLLKINRSIQGALFLFLSTLIFHVLHLSSSSVLFFTPDISIYILLNKVLAAGYPLLMILGFSLMNSALDRRGKNAVNIAMVASVLRIVPVFTDGSLQALFIIITYALFFIAYYQLFFSETLSAKGKTALRFLLISVVLSLLHFLLNRFLITDVVSSVDSDLTKLIRTRAWLQLLALLSIVLQLLGWYRLMRSFRECKAQMVLNEETEE